MEVCLEEVWRVQGVVDLCRLALLLLVLVGITFLLVDLK